MWVNWEGLCKQEAEGKERVKTMAQELFWVHRLDHQSSSITAGQSGLWPHFLFKLKSLLSFDSCVSFEFRQTAVYTGATLVLIWGFPLLQNENKSGLLWCGLLPQVNISKRELFSSGWLVVHNCLWSTKHRLWRWLQIAFSDCILYIAFRQSCASQHPNIFQLVQPESQESTSEKIINVLPDKTPQQPCFITHVWC